MPHASSQPIAQVREDRAQLSCAPPAIDATTPQPAPGNAGGRDRALASAMAVHASPATTRLGGFVRSVLGRIASPGTAGGRFRRARPALAAGVLGVALAGCGPAPEQMALEQRVKDLREHLAAANATADAGAARIAELERQVRALGTRGNALETELAGALARGNAAGAELTRLRERVMARASAVGLDVDKNASAAEAYASLAVQEGARDTAAREAMQRSAQVMSEVDALRQGAEYLREQVARLQAETDAARAGWAAERARAGDLTRALGQARVIVNDAVADRRAAEEDNVALVQANEMLREQANGASLAAAEDRINLEQMRSRLEATGQARDYFAARSETLARAGEASASRLGALEESLAEARDQLQAANAQVRKVNDALIEQEGKADTLAGQLADTLAERDALQTELAAANERVASLTEAHATATRATREAAARFEASRASNEVLRDDSRRQTAELRKAADLAATLRSEIKAGQKLARSLEQERTAAATRASELEAALNKAHAETEAARANNGERIAALATTVDQLRGVYTAMRGRLESAAAEAFAQRERAAEAVRALTTTEERRVALLEALAEERRTLARVKAARDYLIDKVEAASGG